jgi:hypothetical protein
MLKMFLKFAVLVTLLSSLQASDLSGYYVWEKVDPKDGHRQVVEKLFLDSGCEFTFYITDGTSTSNNYVYNSGRMLSKYTTKNSKVKTEDYRGTKTYKIDGDTIYKIASDGKPKKIDKYTRYYKQQSESEVLKIAKKWKKETTFIKNPTKYYMEFYDKAKECK